MTVDYAKLNASIGKSLIDEVKEAEAGTSDFPEVPLGTYEVRLEKAEIGLTQSSRPKATLWFKISGGDYDGQILFANYVIDNGFGLANCNKMLRSLDTKVDVSFEGDYEKYADMLMDVVEEAEVDNLSFELVYGRNKKDYPTYKVTDIFSE